MSFLNGLGALAGGISDLSGAALTDVLTRKPLLNSTPPPDSTSDAPAAAAPAAAPADAAGKGDATSVAGVPAAYLPIYEAASKRTGIPIDLLIAQGKQESNFNPNAIGSAGEIGLHQIKPSTAADPGYGLKGIDPATLKDPSVNINFAADYMRAKAGNPNFNDPAAVDAALRGYNGGGDPNYVANVRSHLGTGAS